MSQAKQRAEGDSAAKAVDEAPRPARDVEALQKQIRELQQAGQYRSLFLARLAHELRTPLTSILGFSEILLSQEKLTDAQRSFCERIQNSARQLQISVNQLSDLARLEAGQTSLSKQSFALGDTLREVLPACTRSAEKKRVQLTVVAGDDLPVVTSDRARVRVVIYNLLSNAINRSPEGGEVRAEARAVTDGVTISITDRGDLIDDLSKIGILAADDNTSAADLGLLIARQSIDVLGGSISAHNGDGEVIVTVTLPLGQAK